ncbi:MAG: hypothetical protein KF708_19985 [Pirellulales bacterium]|nr:hypothetical protein [Pirellulales bacterium]
MAKKRTPASDQLHESISLQDSNGKLRILIGVSPSPSGGPFMNFYDADGRVRMTFILDSSGDPYISLSLQAGEQVLSLGASSECGGGGIDMSNGAGNCRYIISAQSDGVKHDVFCGQAEIDKRETKRRRKKG